jgi:putative oxidoreductase
VLLVIGVPIIVEIVGGLLVLLRAFVPLATIPMAVILLVAIATLSRLPPM